MMEHFFHLRHDLGLTWVLITGTHGQGVRTAQRGWDVDFESQEIKIYMAPILNNSFLG